MKRSRFSEHQIIAILKAVEAGVDDEDFCCKHEISEATYFQWKSQYGGMQASDIKRLLELEVNMQKAATDKLENMLFRRTGHNRQKIEMGSFTAALNYLMPLVPPQGFEPRTNRL